MDKPPDDQQNKQAGIMQQVEMEKVNSKK